MRDMSIEPDEVDDLMDDGPPTPFSLALDAWRDHLREIGYSTPDITIMLIGFGAGWEAHLDANL